MGKPIATLPAGPIRSASLPGALAKGSPGALGLVGPLKGKTLVALIRS